jgi:hypothetical protein
MYDKISIDDNDDKEAEANNDKDSESDDNKVASMTPTKQSPPKGTAKKSTKSDVKGNAAELASPMAKMNVTQSNVKKPGNPVCFSIKVQDWFFVKESRSTSLTLLKSTSLS